MLDKHVIEKLSLYIDNALTPLEKKNVEEHLNQCQPCRQELELLQKTASVVSQWQAPSLDPDFEQRVKERIYDWEMEKEATTMKPQWKLIGIGIPAPAIAGIIVFLIAGGLLSTQLYLSRSVRGRARDASDKIGEEYVSPSTTRKIAASSTEKTAPSNQATTTTQALVKGTADVWSTPISYSAQSSARTGWEKIGSYEPYYMMRGDEKSRLSESEVITRTGHLTAGDFRPLNGGVSAPCVLPESDVTIISPPPFHTEEYDRVYENRFLEVLQNPLSTFSIDVDTASYSNVRRFINSNQLPPKDAVRIEEMINYFTYDYPQPEGDVPFSINMEIAQCPWNVDHNVVLIGLQGKRMKTDQMPPSNLVFLLDVSGSMDDPKKLPLLKSAFRLLVDQLRGEDRVAIVVYAGAAGLVLDSTSGYDKEKIFAAIERLNAGGSTAGGAGIKLAYEIAKANYMPEGNNRVILATDGDFNVGVSSDAELVRIIEEKRKQGVFLTVLGFGTGNYKDSKMEQLADKGNGNYAYIDTILEAKKVFVHELSATLFTIAKDVKIQIEFNPKKIKAYRLIGYENRMLKKEDFNDDTKDAGELGAGHTVTALYEIVMADSNEEFSPVDPLKYQETTVKHSNELMTVKLRYKDPDEDTSKLLSRTITDKDVMKESISGNLVFASAVAEFGLLLRDSEYKGSASYKHVLEQAQASKGHDKEGYRAEFIKLVEIAELLDRKK